jgi:hypothetical protein
MPAAVNQFCVMTPTHPLWPRLLLVAVLCSSCSVIGLKRVDPELPPGEPPDCTSTWTLPLIDMAIAVITGSAGVLFHAAASSEANDGGDGGGFRVAGWTSIGLGAVFIGSGAYGAVHRGRCSDAKIRAERVAPTAPVIEEGPVKGGRGSACKDDADCDEDLLCGEPMKTCVPANPPEESPSP